MVGLIYHPDREEVLAQNHLRPFLPLECPSAVSFLAFLRSPGQKSQVAPLIAQLCSSFAIQPPDETAQYFNADFGLFQLRWEKHTEFDSLQIYCKPASTAKAARKTTEQGFEKTAFEALPASWLRILLTVRSIRSIFARSVPIPMIMGRSQQFRVSNTPFPSAGIPHELQGLTCPYA